MSTSSASSFYGLSRDELAGVLSTQFGEAAFRAKQLFEWVYAQRIDQIERMTNISKPLRAKLADFFLFPKARTLSRQISIDGTRKYLFEVAPGKAVESVMIKQPKRDTLCISSQVGCAMGCTFCRTATMGLKSNLSAAEIVSQVMAVIEDAKNFDDAFSNIVFMGMGEPLHNFDGVVRAIKILTDPNGLAIAPRKITVSTSGLVPKIKAFFESGVGVSLAVSLNATTNEVRSKIMPVNKKYPIEELLGCLRELPATKRRKFTIEYVMLAGLNDLDSDLKRLPKLLHAIPAKVNLIPYNENAELGFRAPSKEKVRAWQSSLISRGVDATIRWSKGADIKAACGQLANIS